MSLLLAYHSGDGHLGAESVIAGLLVGLLVWFVLSLFFDNRIAGVIGLLVGLLVAL